MESRETKHKWPQKMLKATLECFGRMPRSGWNLSCPLYCEKFACATSLSEFKRQVNSAIINLAGRKCLQKIFAEESTKRIKAIDMCIEERMLHEAKMETEVIMQEKKDRGTTKAKWLRKIIYDAIDPLILGAVNRAAGEDIALRPSMPTPDIARQIQAAQECYEQAMHKGSKTSEWRKTTIKKI